MYIIKGKKFQGQQSKIVLGCFFITKACSSHAPCSAIQSVLIANIKVVITKYFSSYIIAANLPKVYPIMPV